MLRFPVQTQDPVNVVSPQLNRRQEQYKFLRVNGDGTAIQIVPPNGYVWEIIGGYVVHILASDTILRIVDKATNAYVGEIVDIDLALGSGRFIFCNIQSLVGGETIVNTFPLPITIGEGFSLEFQGGVNSVCTIYYIEKKVS